MDLLEEKRFKNKWLTLLKKIKCGDYFLKHNLNAIKILIKN
jgi:hypothetical protein